MIDFNKTYIIMKKNACKTLLYASLLLLAGCGGTDKGQMSETPDYTRYVDPYIGSGGHGHVFVGANVPFGFVQLGPTSIPQQWDWTSGYHISDSTVIGFPHTHLSGTGIGDLNDVTLMPVVGEVKYARGTEDDQKSGLWSYSDRSKEKVRPGYYSTRLMRYGVDVELTATKRVGFHKYTFPTADDAAVVFDLQNGGCWDAPTETYMAGVDSVTVEGYRFSTGWANEQKVFFVAKFSRPFKSFDLIEDGMKDAKGGALYARASFDTEAGEPLYVKVALSPTSIENAGMNLQAELPGWDFDATVEAAREEWNKELGKIDIQASDEKTKRVFYTALYHTMVAPSEFCDVNGDYYGADHKMHKDEGFVNYTTLSCWDTYRAAHPLMTIIHPERMADIANTFINIYKQQGKLPVWHLMGCETNTMVGNPGISILADAVLKGYVKDTLAAYEALKTSAMLDERGMDIRKKYGFIPYDKMLESVAIDMEYAIADWAVAQVAKRMGYEDDYEYFLDRSHSYRNFFDPATGFMRGKGTNGEFHEPFNPFASTHREDDYCEGNAWQYTFLVPHDFDGLVGCYGSKEAFIEKLDSLFVAESTLVGEDVSPDISGLIGQYAHGNEPSHHVTYFYTMAGQPWKGADKIRRILTTLYNDCPDGLSGNEDVGAMSAWYVLSAMGLYQVEPAGGRYFFGSPIVDKAELKVRDGVFTITARNNSAENKYIQSVRLNGQPYAKGWIDFEDMAKGGSLEFEMGAGQVCWY